MRCLYSLLFYLTLPFVMLRLAWKGRRIPGYRARWRERLALQSVPDGDRDAVWIHAVSVGEVEAVIPLVRTLQREGRVLLTTTTPTGSDRVRAVFGDGVAHVYLPYDLPCVVNRFLDRYRPRRVLIVEVEIWPNLFAACGRRGIPLFLVNARLSERSARGYGRLGHFARETLAHVRCVLAQGADDAGRFVRLGVPAGQIQVTGNLKFDLDLPPKIAGDGALLRTTLFGGRLVWIAASTHPGEESAALDAHAQVRRAIPGALLVLAPRHPDRAPEVLALCRQKGFRTVTRSAGAPCDAETDVFVLDTLGELKLFYAASDVAFVGGSLVAIGGHNVLEPAALGVPVVIGPHMDNFREIAGALRAAEGCVTVDDAHTLGQAVADLMAEPQRRAQLAGRARTFVEANRGALQATVAALSA